MGKNLENILKRARKVALPLTVTALLASSPAAYYGIQQKNSEYGTLQKIERILEENSLNSDANIALIMSIVKKESSFYEGAVGRDNEAGLLQLSREVAQQNGLRTSKERLKKSSPLSKLFYIDTENKKDDRFDPEKNLHVGIGYLFELAKNFQRTYNLDESSSIQFGLISYNLGPANVRKLFGIGYSKNPDEFIERLSREKLEKFGISDRKREVTVDYHTRINRFRRDYEQRVSQMRKNGSPSMSEYFRGFFGSFGEIYQRLKN